MGQSKTKMSLIVCGLDNSGKSTILNYLKPEKDRLDSVNATVGYSVETFRSGKQVVFTAFDMGGAKKFRNLWESYYDDVDGVIFVIDAADVLRLVVVKDELQQLLSHPAFTGESDSTTSPSTSSKTTTKMTTKSTKITKITTKKRQIPILFFANKQDLDGAKTPAELSQLLELSECLADRPFRLFAACALKGTGLDDGIAWLRETMLEQQKTFGKKDA